MITSIDPKAKDTTTMSQTKPKNAKQRSITCWATEMDNQSDDTTDWTQSIDQSLMAMIAEDTKPREPSKGDDIWSRVTTHMARNERGQRCRVTRYYQTMKMSKSVSTRTKWRKFGQSVADPPGPHSATTIAAEDVFIQFIGHHNYYNNYSNGTGAEAVDTTHEENPWKRMESSGKGMVKCSHCGLGHWSLQCPYKDQLAALNRPADTTTSSTAAKTAPEEKAAKYIPPSMRAGADRRAGDSDMGWKRDRDEATVRVTNLPEEMTDDDVRELFPREAFGKVTRIYLAKDKVTNRSKGFAFVSFESRCSAEMAVQLVNRHRYGNLILVVEFAQNFK
ncbi:unnamed protein product [Oppiella nova]|uniref:Eukaryotic translation initiation factor 3 subunit G n=1 Tax=Oppiella nova TaxID=334625 RepID=A0A7R9M592_9ACAR|nr:unnamed protein product [Oppiella nova]CAG2171027.1 unnamed protein product [Oppiella nova]